MTNPLIITVEIPEVGVVAATPAVEISSSTTTPPVILVMVPGAPGPTGPPGTNTPVTGEIPAGAQNGVNVTFGTAHTFQPNSTAVYINGLREFIGHDYAESGDNVIIFSDPPLSSDAIRIDYLVKV